MTGDYEPYLPLHSLHQVDAGIWTADGPVTGYGTFGLSLPCPTRMTIIEMEPGKLLVHSPVTFDDHLASAIERLGPVQALVAPSSFHHLHVARWADRFPDARVFVPPVMPESAQLPLRAEPLATGALSSMVEVVIVDAGAWSEAVFFHRPSGSLVVTDLIQNFERQRIKGLLARFMLWAGGCLGDPPRASLDMRLAARRGGPRAQLRSAFDAIRALEPKRVLIAHGAQPQGPTGPLLKKAFAWA